jgi:hypothetical protein
LTRRRSTSWWRRRSIVRVASPAAYPPNDLGPAALLQPGRRPHAQPSIRRTNVGGRAAAGDASDLVPVDARGDRRRRARRELFGFDVAPAGARDVARADGAFPLVLFSHGNAGVASSRSSSRRTSRATATWWARIITGTLDIGADVRRLLGRNRRATDLRPANCSRGTRPAAPSPARSTRPGSACRALVRRFTTFALAAGAPLGALIGAFMPLAPASPFDAAFLGSITKPILIQGGSLDGTTPFDTQQAAPFQSLPSGAVVVALAEIVGGGHFTFSDVCEVPDLVGCIGGSTRRAPRHRRGGTRTTSSTSRSTSSMDLERDRATFAARPRARVHRGLIYTRNELGRVCRDRGVRGAAFAPDNRSA